MRVLPVVLCAAIGALVACGEPDPAPVERPTGAGELVVRVERLESLLPPLELQRQVPEISVYGNGLVLVPGPGRDLFPGPAGYPLEAFHINPDPLDRIVARAVAVGLQGPDRRIEQTGPDFVADSGALRITVVTDGARHVTTAAEFFDPETSPQLRELATFLDDLLALRGADLVTRYEPAAVRVFLALLDPGFGLDLEGGAKLEWPLLAPIATWGDPLPPDGQSAEPRCGIVRGEELAVLWPVLEAATSTTVVVDAAGDERLIAYRVLLPDEDGC